MGEFKPLLPFGEQTVIESCVKNLCAAGIAEIIVVVGHRADDVRKELTNFEVAFAINPDPKSAMSASIAVGVKEVSTDAKAVLITLVDHPAVPASIITQLTNQWRRGGARLIQPEYEGHGGHPVLIDLSYRAALMNLDPRRGLRSLFDTKRPEVRRVIVDSPYVARDMDTWQDYLRLHQDVFGRLPNEA